jgi:hypothetical protein
MLPGDPVATPMGPMQAYLIEARSIGGLSGSPVFAVVEPYTSLSALLVGYISPHFSAC